jgi:predicted peptidase
MMKKGAFAILISIAVSVQNAFSAPKVDDRPAAERDGKKSSVEIALAMTEAKMWQSPNGKMLPYRLHVPANPEQGRRYPLVVHMHGAGSRGTNNLNQIRKVGRRMPAHLFVSITAGRRPSWLPEHR